MMTIHELSESIKSELKDARHDAIKAQHYAMKPEHKELAITYKKIGLQELEHAMLWHGAAVKEIDAYKLAGHTVPPAMQARYDVLHEMMIEHYNETKNMLDKVQ